MRLWCWILSVLHRNPKRDPPHAEARRRLYSVAANTARAADSRVVLIPPISGL